MATVRACIGSYRPTSKHRHCFASNFIPPHRARHGRLPCHLRQQAPPRPVRPSPKASSSSLISYFFLCVLRVSLSSSPRRPAQHRARHGRHPSPLAAASTTPAGSAAAEGLFLLTYFLFLPLRPPRPLRFTFLVSSSPRSTSSPARASPSPLAAASTTPAGSAVKTNSRSPVAQPPSAGPWCNGDSASRI